MRRVLAVCVALLAVPISARGAEQTSVTIDLGEPGEVIARVGIDDSKAATGALRVTALTLSVDGEPDQELLVVAGSGRSHYEAILSLPAGTSRLDVGASHHWPAAPGLQVKALGAAPVGRDDPRCRALRFAPRIALRPDTVGVADDLPLLVYAEEERAGSETTLRYTVVFSHENGGTPAIALFARWGRTLDIELAYEVVLRGDAVVAERFQGPGHEMRSFAGTRRAGHPVLSVATSNNMFLDGGDTGPQVAPVPLLVSLRESTRESVVDGEPWIYRLMAQELRDQQLVDANERVFDPSEYLYAEARLTLVAAAVAVRVAFSGGAQRASHLGDPGLAVARQGWVRSAVYVGDGTVIAAGWECTRLVPPVPGDPAEAPAGCVVESARAFRIAADGRIGSSLVPAERFELRPGEARLLPVALPSPSNRRVQ